MSEPERCELCGMAIPGEPVVRRVAGEEHHFDTEGCADLYEAAAAAGVLDEALTDPEPDRAGLLERLTRPRETVFFTLGGMWCASCATSSQRVLRHEEGVYAAEISFAAGKGRIDFDPRRTDVDRLMGALERLGYEPHVTTESGPVAREDRSQERMLVQVIVAVAFMMQVMLLYFEQLYGLYAAGDFASRDVRMVQYLVWLLATPALFIGGQSFLRGAWQSLRTRSANMDTLVALGTLAAYTYSAYAATVGGREVYFDSVVMITAFVMFGRYLETIGGARARKDVRSLLQLRPESAWKAVGGEYRQVRIAEVGVGDRILVKPGERVPADAQVVDGTGSVDEALLTGESVPRTVSSGGEVYAGTLLEDSPIEAEVVRTGEDTRLAQVRALVQHTLESKAPVQRLADRASAWLTLIILAAAVVTFGAWMLAGEAASVALTHAVAVLVVACPCALGLATPLALSVSLGASSRTGVLVREPVSLERAAEATIVAFDKTGTLTEGTLRISAVGAIETMTEDDVVCRAAAVEQRSEHPLAAAITAACSQPPSAADVHAEPGLGISATVDGARIAVGSESYVAATPSGRLRNGAAERITAGQTVVWVAEDGRVIGWIALADTPRTDAPTVLRALRDAQIRPILVSGDSVGTTAAIAGQLGIDEYHGAVSPEGKARLIETWQGDGDRIVMAGDGVNDAPALAQADVSVTVAGGTDVASETSDVVIMRDELVLIPWFIELSALTRKVTQENLGWALGYNLFAVPIAATGLISPAIAAAAMATSSVLVVGNSLRLRYLLRRHAPVSARREGMTATRPQAGHATGG